MTELKGFSKRELVEHGKDAIKTIESRVAWLTEMGYEIPEGLNTANIEPFRRATRSKNAIDESKKDDLMNLVSELDMDATYISDYAQDKANENAEKMADEMTADELNAARDAEISRMIETIEPAQLNEMVQKFTDAIIQPEPAIDEIEHAQDIDVSGDAGTIPEIVSYYIAQLPHTEENHGRIFWGMEFQTGGVNLENYDIVYSGKIDRLDQSDNEILNNLFQTFNVDHPADYRGRSLSVSDVVTLNGKSYFCDTAGWVELPPVADETAPEQPAAPVVKSEPAPVKLPKAKLRDLQNMNRAAKHLKRYMEIMCKVSGDGVHAVSMEQPMMWRDLENQIAFIENVVNGKHEVSELYASDEKVVSYFASIPEVIEKHGTGFLNDYINEK